MHDRKITLDDRKIGRAPRLARFIFDHGASRSHSPGGGLVGRPFARPVSSRLDYLRTVCSDAASKSPRFPLKIPQKPAILIKKSLLLGVVIYCFGNRSAFNETNQVIYYQRLNAVDEPETYPKNHRL